MIREIENKVACPHDINKVKTKIKLGREVGQRVLCVRVLQK